MIIEARTSLRPLFVAHARSSNVAKAVGHTVGGRMRIGLWSSDHAGVVATLRLPPLKAH